MHLLKAGYHDTVLDSCSGWISESSQPTNITSNPALLLLELDKKDRIAERRGTTYHQHNDESFWELIFHLRDIK